VAESAPPSAPYAAFAPGSRVAGYRLEEQLGRGGMAVVFRAYDDRLNRQVALKILAPALAADSAFRQRFMAESQAAAAVDDPNIIPVYEAGEADGVLFIAMRLVRGGDLKTMVSQHGPLSPSRAEWILSAVASALDAAHSAGLIHRDVKPANMLLEMRPGRPDHVYLSDFGVSKAALDTSGLTSSGQFLGTVDYAAPEQIQDRAVDGRTDQYALGCSAFELLCGQPPFFGKQWMAGMFAHVSQDPPAPTSIRRDLPAAVDPVFAKVLAKSPADRYASCEDFAAALRTALGIRAYVVDKSPGTEARGVARMGGIAAEDEITLAPAAVGAWEAGRPEADQVATAGGTEPPGTLSVTVNGYPRGRDALRAESLRAGLQPETAAQRLSWRSPRLVLSLLAIVVLLAGATVAGFALANSAAASVSYRFPRHNFPDGLSVQQVWTLSGQDGSLLNVTLTASNATAIALTAQLEEPIPAAVAGDPLAVRFHPAAQVLTGSRVVVWDVRLPADGHASVRYQADEPAAGATQARLHALTRAFGAVAAQQVLEPLKPGGVLESVTISPGSVQLSAGQSVRLRLRGMLSTGSAAPKAELAKAIWSSANPAIATVSQRGRVVGVSTGVTQITARIGPIRESVIVIVLGSGGAGPGTGSGYSPPPGQTSSPSPSATTPSSSSSSSVSPSPSSTTGSSPSPSQSGGSPTPSQAASPAAA
jgi:hypothetical protein